LSRKQSTGQAGKGRPTPPQSGKGRPTPPQSGKGRPTPPRASRGPKGRPTPARAGSRRVTTGPVYRQRRFPPLPLALKLLLAAVWLAALVLALLLVDPWPARVGIMIAVTFTLPLLVVLVRDPSRRTRR
jgi:hypothetical protein